MPTLRRYCRVSKYTVLECRIYLDNPADLNSWLLSPRYGIIPRIFASVKPLVLPKLFEETERAKTKGKKAAAVKDVVVEDDFEVSLFLTNSGTRHTVMTKRKTLRAAPQKLLSNSSKLTGGDSGGRGSLQIEIRRESPATGNSNSPVMSSSDIPAAPVPIIVVPEPSPSSQARGARRSTRKKSKKRKSPSTFTSAPAAGGGGGGGGGNSDSDGSDSYEPPQKRHKVPIGITIPDDANSEEDLLFDPNDSEAEDGDKKKMAVETVYEGFNIYSRILCLVVKRRGTTGRRAGATSTAAQVAKGKVMEEWITMSQAIKDGDGGDAE